MYMYTSLEGPWLESQFPAGMGEGFIFLLLLK